MLREKIIVNEKEYPLRIYYENRKNSRVSITRSGVLEFPGF